MSYRTTVTGKIYNLKEIKYQKDNEDRIGVEFTVGEPTGRKHPEGHPYAGKSVVEFTRCKSFTDTQASMILKRFKDGDYITLDGELRVDAYDRQNVDVLVPRTGQEPLKLKATVPNFQSLEFIIDRVHFVTDAPESYNNNTPAVEASTASELEAIAAAQAAAAQTAAATAANATAAAPAASVAGAQPATAGASVAGTTDAPF